MCTQLSQLKLHYSASHTFFPISQLTSSFPCYLPSHFNFTPFPSFLPLWSFICLLCTIHTKSSLHYSHFLMLQCSLPNLSNSFLPLRHPNIDTRKCYSIGRAKAAARGTAQCSVVFKYFLTWPLNFNEPVTFARCALTPFYIWHLPQDQKDRRTIYIDTGALISLEDLTSPAIINTKKHMCSNAKDLAGSEGM